MQVDVNLANVSAAWHFPGSATLQTWLEGRPWVREGGLCVLRTENDTFVFEQVQRAIRRAAHAVHKDDGLSVRSIPCGGAAGTPKQALMHHFNIPLHTSPIEARDAIHRQLADRHQLLVMVAESPVGPDDWDVFVVLGDYYRKAATPLPLAVIALDPHAHLVCRPMCQFDVGYLSQAVMTDAASTDEATLWSRYVHVRAWWDAGGSMRRAWELSSRLGAVEIGDDDAMESNLQAYACEQLQTSGALANLRIWLDAQRGQGVTDVEAELLGGGLLWRPPGLLSLHVVPWAARALLAQPKPVERDIWRLRPNLVCAPLAAELLALCMFFESRIRAHLTGRGNSDRLRAETVEIHNKFQQGIYQNAWSHYPPQHPARPLRGSDIWAFATLGELLLCCPPGAVADLDRAVLELRNHLAHGHYVTWFHCEKAIRILKRWDTA